MKVAQSLLFCLPENKTNPMAPKNIKISATLNANEGVCADLKLMNAAMGIMDNDGDNTPSGTDDYAAVTMKCLD